MTVEGRSVPAYELEVYLPNPLPSPLHRAKEGNVLAACMDEGMPDSLATMRRFPGLLSADPDIARIPVMVGSSLRVVVETGLEYLQENPSSFTRKRTILPTSARGIGSSSGNWTEPFAPFHAESSLLNFSIADGVG